MTKSILYIAITDELLRDSISTELADDYEMFFYDTLDAVLATANDKPEPDIILCHQNLFENEETEVVFSASFKTNYPKADILLIGSGRPIKAQIEALKHGERGYFDSSLSVSKLHYALQCILQGEVWVERHVVSGLIDELTCIPEVNKQQRQAISSLSPKEIEAARLVSHGATNKMIAKKMGITERTVKSHLTTIFHKMNIADRLSLAIFFRDLR